MKSIRHAAWISIAAILLVGCGGPDELDPDERAAVAETLYPQFAEVHGTEVRSLPPGLQQRLEALLDRLRDGGVDLPARAEIVVTTEPDPDALCLAGGRLLLGRGMLASLRDDAEAAAVLAAAATMCPAADRSWRAGAEAGLPDDAPESLRRLRYIDARLPANAALYRQAVADACSGDCASHVPDALAAAGFGPDAYGQLVHRLSVEQPESLWLERIGGASASAEGVVDGRADGRADQDWSGLADKSEGFEQLAAVQRGMGRGRLDRAYLAMLAAGRALPDDVEARRLHAELDLRNNHGYYARDRLDALAAEGHRVRNADYLRGWILAHQREIEAADALLTPEMERFPRVAGLYELAVLRIRQRRDAEAERLLERASAAGETSPYVRPIADVLRLIERRRG